MILITFNKVALKLKVLELVNIRGEMLLADKRKYFIKLRIYRGIH